MRVPRHYPPAGQQEHHPHLAHLSNPLTTVSVPTDPQPVHLPTGMLSHPPIPIADMAEHMERLKANDSLKLSQEYEVSWGYSRASLTYAPAPQPCQS